VITRCLWILCFLLMQSGMCRSDVALIGLDDRGRFARVEIAGRITKADAERFIELLEVLRPGIEVIDVQLDSPGGDLWAAMQIGEVVRKHWLMTSVSDEPPSNGCMSACVFILAAGAVRIVGEESRVGIHRPHFDQLLFAGLYRAQAKVEYDTLSQSVAAYLTKMGMSERLYQAMMNVPSSEIRFLSYEESKAFSLAGEDPGYGEWVRARNVAKYSLGSWPSSQLHHSSKAR